MDSHRKQAWDYSSSTMNFDHLFGPKDSSSTSSSSTGLFGSIFPPPSSVGGRESRMQDVGSKIFGAPGTHQGNKGESSSRICNKKNINSTNNENETLEPPSNFTSSIYYGGQESYSPTIRTTQPHHRFKKDKDDDESNGNGSSEASRGNWWQGSLYY